MILVCYVQFRSYQVTGEVFLGIEQYEAAADDGDLSEGVLESLRLNRAAAPARKAAYKPEAAPVLVSALFTSLVGAAIAAALGSFLGGLDYSHKTLGGLIARIPTRQSLLIAKFVATFLLAGLVFASLAAVLAALYAILNWIVPFGLLSEPTGSLADLRVPGLAVLILGPTVVVVTFASLGVCAAVIGRSVLAGILGIAGLLIVDAVAATTMPLIKEWTLHANLILIGQHFEDAATPHATYRLLFAVPPGESSLVWQMALIPLLGAALLAILAAAIIISRRDVE